MWGANPFDWLILVVTLFGVAMALYLFVNRRNDVRDSARTKDGVEQYVDDLIAQDIEFQEEKEQSVPLGASCLFEVDNKGETLSHSGILMSWLNNENNKMQLANSIRSGKGRDGRYIYLRDPDHRGCVAVYLKNRPGDKTAVGAAVVSKCKLKSKTPVVME